MTRRASPSAWIRRYHAAAPNAVRLFCFPHAGGSASFYFPLSARLSPNIEVCAVQYPGRQDRRAEPNIDNIAELADAIYRVLPSLDGGQLALFGHSMGAVVAYEVALRMERSGGPPPTRLFVSARRAPSIDRREGVHRRDDQGVVAELRLLRGTGVDLLDDPETREMILPAVRSDYRAIETYRHVPDQAVSCPIVVMVGAEDPRVTADEAKPWAQRTSAEIDLRIFPGGHFYLAENADAIAKSIMEDLCEGSPTAG